MQELYQKPNMFYKNMRGIMHLCRDNEEYLYLFQVKIKNEVLGWVIFKIQHVI